MRYVLHNHFPTLDGPNNVANAGINHLGKSGSGSAPACGNLRAHSTWGKEKFRDVPNKCKRCEEKLAIWDRMKAQRSKDSDGLHELHQRYLAVRSKRILFENSAHRGGEDPNQVLAIREKANKYRAEEQRLLKEYNAKLP